MGGGGGGGIIELFIVIGLCMRLLVPLLVIAIAVADDGCVFCDNINSGAMGGGC